MSTSTDGAGPSITPASSAPGTAADASGLIEDATALGLELRALVHDQFELLTRETRLAATSLVMMTAAAIWIGILLATAWLGLMATLALILMDAGVPAMPAVLSISILSLVLAVLLCGIIRNRARTLGYPATLRTLMHPPLRRADGKHE